MMLTYGMDYHIGLDTYPGETPTMVADFESWWADAVKTHPLLGVSGMADTIKGVARGLWDTAHTAGYDDCIREYGLILD